MTRCDICVDAVDTHPFNGFRPTHGVVLVLCRPCFSQAGLLLKALNTVAEDRVAQEGPCPRCDAWTPYAGVLCEDCQHAMDRLEREHSG